MKKYYYDFIMNIIIDLIILNYIFDIIYIIKYYINILNKI